MKQTLGMTVMWLLLCWVSTVSAATNLPVGIRVHDIGIAPDFTIETMDGEPFSFSETRGSWVFLHFWASWCGPCREEMPEIQKLMEKIPPGKLQYVLVNTAEDEDTVFSFFGEIGLDFDSLIDTDGLATEQYKPRGLPTTILVDPSGTVRYQAIGGRKWSQPVYVEFLNKLTES
ncbi:MAG: TlpA family protein disulfide reductase [bacterium]